MTPIQSRHADERSAFRAELLVGAEEARSLMFRMNSYGTPLDWGFSPDASRPGEYGGFWLAQEALTQILARYLGTRDLAEQVYRECIENGEDVTYNLKAAGLHHTQRRIRFTGTIVYADGSDYSGWLSPDSSWSELDYNADNAIPDLWTEDPQEPDSDPVVWLVGQLRDRLGAIDMSGEPVMRAFYAADAKSIEDGASVRVAAHPDGFDVEEIARAVALIAAEQGQRWAAPEPRRG